MRKILRCALLSVMCTGQSLAEEGFWQPHQLTRDTQLLTPLGLTAAEHQALPLDAITPALARVGLCSAVFVSASGLLLTSSDCVQRWLPVSITGGYSQPDAELPLASLPVDLLQQTEDVTLQVHRGLAGIDDVQLRADALAKLERQLISGCQQQGQYHCEVKSQHHGLEYLLLQYKRLRDVRLVYLPATVTDTPAHSWPRYGSNYVLLRAYVSPSGAAVPYHEANQPYRTAFVPLSAKGVAEHELVLTPAFSPRSYRYSSSSEVRFKFEQWYPNSVRYLQQLVQLLQQLAPEGDERASRYATVLQHTRQQLTRQKAIQQHYQHSDMVAARQRREQALLQWINTSPVRQQLYGPALTNLAQLLEQHHDMQLRDLVLQYLHYAQLPALARQLYATALLPDTARQTVVARLKQQLDSFASHYDAQIDMELALHFLAQYSQLPARLRLPALDQYFALSDGFNREVVRHKLSAIYRGTSLQDEQQRQLWLNRSAVQFQHSNDPLINFTLAMYSTTQQLAQQRRVLQAQLSAARAAVIEVIAAYNDAHSLATYAEANGTLRISLGRVSGYQPTDAVWYQPFSSLSGLLQRQGIKQVDNADLSKIPVNFLTSTDSCSDYSGAVNFNLQGELVGVMFAGMQHNRLADWHYDAALNRTVHVDSRFILWQLGQTAAGRTLMKEMAVQP